MALLVAPCDDKHVTYVSYVTIDTNHVMVNDFDVMNGRNYVIQMQQLLCDG